MENRLRSKVIIILWLRWMKLCKFKRIFRSNLYTNRWCNKITFSNCVQKAIITLHTNLIKLSILCGTNVNKISNKYLSMLTMMAHCQWLWLWQYTYNTTIEQFLICTMHVNEFICAKGYSKYLLCQCIGTLLLIRVHIHIDTSKMEFRLNGLEMELELNTLKMVSHYQNVSKTTCWLWDNRMPKVLPHEMNCDWDEI